MKKAFIKSGLLLLMLSVVFIPVRASSYPIIAVYFDRNLTQTYADCPSGPLGTVIDTLYLAASGFTEPIEGVEFQLELPPYFAFLGEFNNNDKLWIGYSVDGMSLVFLEPVDASSPVILLEIRVLWLCDGCASIYDAPINVLAHPETGSLRAVTSSLEFQDAVGWTSVVCPCCKDCEHEVAAVAAPAAPALPASQQCVLDCPAGDGGVILPGELPEEHHSPDLNEDGVVEIYDLAMFAFDYPYVYHPEHDFYCTGNVDLIDFVLLGRHWQHTAPIPVKTSTWGHIKALYLE